MAHGLCHTVRNHLQAICRNLSTPPPPSSKRTEASISVNFSCIYIIYIYLSLSDITIYICIITCNISLQCYRSRLELYKSMKVGTVHILNLWWLLIKVWFGGWIIIILDLGNSSPGTTSRRTMSRPGRQQEQPTVALNGHFKASHATGGHFSTIREWH